MYTPDIYDASDEKSDKMALSHQNLKLLQWRSIDHTRSRHTTPHGQKLLQNMRNPPPSLRTSEPEAFAEALYIIHPLRHSLRHPLCHAFGHALHETIKPVLGAERTREGRRVPTEIHLVTTQWVEGTKERPVLCDGMCVWRGRS